MEHRERSISVQRRLSLLVATEVLTALVLVILGVVSARALATDSAFLQRYVLVPIQTINAGLDDVAQLGETPAKDELLLRRLDTLVTHYRTEIQVADNPSPDARRQTTELRNTGHVELIQHERQVVESLQRSVDGLVPLVAGGAVVDRAEADTVRSSLRELLRINLAFVDAAEADIVSRVAHVRTLLISVGLLGIALAGALAWQVRQAIAPRILELVAKVLRFREFGVNERVLTAGNDEIAVLGNAIDAGFRAISERAREREQFLAVAAHELKTPMTSILGFTRAARDPEQCERALKIVERQTKRLGHLVEDLLWVANLRTGQLEFHPGPLDLTDVARRIADEVGETDPSHPVAFHGPPNVHVLLDETLTTHAIWSLLKYGGVLSSPSEPIDLEIEPRDSRVVVTVKVHGPKLPTEAEARIFEPFSTMQYEGRPRSVMGLFLCRELARVQGGGLRVEEQSNVGPVFVMDLPA